MSDWDLTDCDQGIFGTLIVFVLWFKEVVPMFSEKKYLNEIHQGMTIQPLDIKNVHVRITLEQDPERPWNKA